MNWRAIRAIVSKDLRVVVRSRAVMLPLIILPLIFFTVLPASAALIPKLPTSSMGQMDTFLKQMPETLKADLEGLTPSQQIALIMVVYFLAPMYLIVPLMVASVIAADSFAGEKERKTLEPLLYTPTTDWELFVAKILSAWVPAVLVAWAGFVVYSIVVNLAAGPAIGHIFFPNLMWVILAIWVAPAAAALSLGVMVLVSARVQSFQEAYQMGAMVVLPVVLLLIGQATGVMYFSVILVAVLGLVLWLISAGLFWFSVRAFRRPELARNI